MRLTKKQLRREINKIISSYSDEEIFGSEAFEDILQGFITGACEKFKRVPILKNMCDTSNPMTACTDGLNVINNTMCSLDDEKSRWERYLLNIGRILHESGHCLFTPFNDYDTMYQRWNLPHMTFWPNTPKDSEDVVEYLNTHPNFKMVYISKMKSVENILEDSYIENRLFERFDGLAINALSFLRDVLYDKGKPEQELYDRVLNGECSLLDCFISLLLVTRTDKPIKSNKEELTEEQSVIKTIMKDVFALCDDEIKQSRIETDPMKRCDILNSLFVKLFPLMPQAEDNMDYSSSMSSSMTSDEESKTECGEDGRTAEPKGDTDPIDDRKIDTDSMEKSKEEADSSDKTEDKMDEVLEQIAEEELNNRNDKKIEDDFKKSMKLPKTPGANQKGEEINRHKVTSDDIRNYVSDYKRIESKAKHLAKKLENLLSNRQTESVESGFIMGQRFNVRDLKHNDGKYFSRIKVPDGDQEVCMAILVDESGSMRNLYREARRACILIEDALRRNNVPLMVAGHTSTYGYKGGEKLIVNNYIDFDSTDKNERYRLGNITARLGNIDGGAITYVGERLLKQPEQQKVMIVISDGEPAGSSFYSRDWTEDTVLAIEHYRKRGIKVFGAVIDSYEAVSKIYGNNFVFDCRNGKLEENLIRLVKRYLRRR